MKYTLQLIIFLSLALLVPPIIVSAMQVNPTPMNKSNTDASQIQALDGLVDVGGRRLYIKCIGKGSPTVILEAGLGGSSADWDKVMPAVGKFTRVCAYDRAGRGKSDPAPQPRTGRRIIDDLHTLLAQAGENRPYVLVAHSFGGMYAILYAGKYSTDIVGMVLVDSSHEDQSARYEALMTPEQVKESRERRAKNAEGVDTDAIREEVKASGWRTDIPLYVLVHGRVTPDMIPPGWSSEQMAKRQQVWREMQADLARRSSNSRMVIAEKSGHYIQDDQPDLVIEAIKQVVVSARKNMKKAGGQK